MEQDGVVFIDEVDKIVNPANHVYSGRDASSEGVQRDLLPIIEGSEVTRAWLQPKKLREAKSSAESQRHRTPRIFQDSFADF